LCLISSNVCGADERIQAAERRALIAAGNAESAYLQRANVQLIAPEVQQQIQDLADQISLAAGTDRRFRVVVLNENFLSTQSSANGDIFIPTGYLDMLEDRDELAFCLAREIATQVKGLRLKEMKHYLEDQRRKQNANTVIGIVVSSTVAALYGTAAGRLDDEIIRSTGKQPVIIVGIRTVNPTALHSPSIGAVRGPGGLISAPQSPSPQLEPKVAPALNYQGLSDLTGLCLNWVPTLANNKILAITSHIVDVAFEDADPEHRKLRNQLGIAFMQMAGYNSASGQKVIKKLDDYWANSAAPSTATPKAELK
jgi:hypothetical protein